MKDIEIDIYNIYDNQEVHSIDDILLIIFMEMFDKWKDACGNCIYIDMKLHLS